MRSSISSKKRMNEFVFTTVRIVFVRFLEEIDDPKKPFQNNWPLRAYCPNIYLWMCCKILSFLQSCLKQNDKETWREVCKDLNRLSPTHYGLNYWFQFKIVLTYWEKKLFYWSRKTLEIRGWRPRICKIFEIARIIYSNIDRSDQFLQQNTF